MVSHAHHVDMATIGALSPSFGDFGGRPTPQKTATIGDGVTPRVQPVHKKGMDHQTAELVGRVDELGNGALQQANGIGDGLDRVAAAATKGMIGGFALASWAAQGLGGDFQTVAVTAPEPQGQAVQPAYLSQVAGMLSGLSNDYQNVSLGNSGRLSSQSFGRDQDQSRGMAI